MTSPHPRPSRTRFAILALISLAVAVNYLDRAVIGIASPSMAQEFALSPVAMGLIFSAFSWSYFAAQIPGGLALDRFGARLVYLVALAGWSLSTLLHATATGFASLFGWRISLGLFEAPCFPANSNIVGAWFPRAERARAIGVYTAAEYVALGFASPLLLWVLHSHGWRALFLVSGMLGLVLVPLWSKLYREPAEHPGINTAELALIRDGGGRVAGETAAFTSARLWQLAHHPQIIALCIGQFAVYSTFVFFLTWFPTYLATARHMAWIRLGFFASLPYLAGFFGILFAGWLSDFLLQRGASLNNARKIPVIAGLLLASSIVLANYVESDAVVVAILSLAFFAQAMSSSGWSVLSEIAPPGTLGMVGSLFSAAANLSGIVTPLVIAAIYQQTGSFNLALAFVGAVAAAGAAAWIFFVGDLKPIAG
jgi:ACS family D-galactonate transporter-like MFS transporter